MRRLSAGLTVAVFVLALGALAFATTQAISDQFVDQACYARDNSNTGVDQSAQLLGHIVVAWRSTQIVIRQPTEEPRKP